MLTKLGYYADKVLEIGWLAAAVFVPLFFNVYSSRVFEPDKISLLRSLVLIMTAAWVIKLLEGGYRALMQRNAEPAANGVANGAGRAKMAAAVDGAARARLPSWLGILRIPMLIPVLVYALAYLLSSIFTVTPDATIWGSYQRLQGTYSQYSYIMLAVIIVANMRTRPQFERLINFMLLTSMVVAVYGIIQALRLDPLPWAGDTATRVASTMGNAIFVAAWLIMVAPFAAYRLFTGLSATITARNASAQVVAIEPEASLTESERRRQSRMRPADVPSYGWAAVMAGLGVILIQLFFLFMALQIVAGLPFPDASMWWVLPLALVVFYAGCWALEWLGNHRDDPMLSSVVLRVVGVALFLVSVLAFLFTWAVEKVGTGDTQHIEARIGIDLGGFLWVLFFMLLWGTVGAGAYALAASERMAGDTTPDRGIMRIFLNIGYGLLFLIQVICIYLSQSRGPWLGFGAAFVTFAVAMWLVGRRSHTRWMARIGGSVAALSLILALFVGALNIPDSPLKSLDKLPVVGRGIERLSTLTQTDIGTGKVRELIWQGATNLILSDPTRAVIGWGPEAMYVAYNPFYPPELAQVELRNATPDRSHNVEFDHLVTMGVLGLLAYYFMVGSFFFLGVKALKRATGTRDQLVLITLISAMAAHFVEIQTGIQIAATWTYFYFFVSMLVVFAYFLNPYLRRETEPRTEAASATMPVAAAVPALAEASVPVTAGKTPARGGASVAVAHGSNGRAANGAASGSRVGRSTSLPQSADARRKQQISRAYGSNEREWVKNPAMLVLYGILALLALILTFAWNESGVQADTLYKQGQSYDTAQRWPEAIAFYQKAIDLQPNQDYYYLFLGRSWLQFAQQAMQETDGNLRTRTPYPLGEDKNPQIKASNDALRRQEQLLRLQQSEKVLKQAHELNPLNSDHYANLGRLYLWWGSPAPGGGGDASKLPMAVEELQLATQRTPGNAQIRDELAVAYSYNGQFDKAIDTLNYSQNSIDPTYARTPFIKAQLYQERLGQVRDALTTGKPLPTQGETDYGKLAVDTGKAFADTLKLDPGTFIDQSFKSRIQALMDASKPITATTAQTSVSPATLRNVLTDTVTAALQSSLPIQEKSLASYMRGLGAYTGAADVVPSDLLQKLYNDPNWAAVTTTGGSKVWLDPNMVTLTHNASLVNYALGYIYSITGKPGEPTASYTRALALEPTNQLVIQEAQK